MSLRTIFNIFHKIISDCRCTQHTSSCVQKVLVFRLGSPPVLTARYTVRSVHTLLAGCGDKLTPAIAFQVEAAPADKGALRVARADLDVLLCEELKQLYTALTRAKNNVIMFDSNMAKRAPFFNYLRRLGMAQYVSRSVTALHARTPKDLHTCFHKPWQANDACAALC